MKAWSVRLGLCVAVILASTSLVGCPVLSFQFLFQNDGDYPVIGLFIEPGFVPNDAVNLLSEPVQPGTEIVIDRIFPRGLAYEAVAVFDVDGNLFEEIPPTIDTSALGEPWVTYYAYYGEDGSHGSGYSYGLPN